MKWFAVFDQQTGRIARSGSCAPEDLGSQAMDGESVAEVGGPINAACQRIDPESGQVVAYQPPKPDATHLSDWEWSGVRWISAPTLEGVRASAVATLRARIRSIEENTDRALRQLVIEAPGHPGAARMQAIEDAVEPLREAISAAQIAVTAEEIKAAIPNSSP